MKNLFLVFSAFATALVFSGCSKSNSGPSNIANVMFVDGCSAPSNIDTKINNVKLNAASNLSFFKSSGYLSVTAGTSVNINFYLTTGGTPLCNSTGALSAGNNYSVFVGGLVTGPSFVITLDTLTAPASGKAKIRFINLSSDTLYEKFSVGTQTLDSNITYTQCTPFYEVTATTSIGVSAVDPAQTSTPYLALLSNQAFIAGKIYTILLTGTHSGSGTSALTLTVINNN